MFSTFYPNWDLPLSRRSLWTPLSATSSNGNGQCANANQLVCPEPHISMDGRPATVRLITATKLPARHAKLVKARVDGVDQPGTSPKDLWEKKGLCVEEAVLEPDGELCVSVPIKNPTCEPICLTPGEILGKVQPVTVVLEPSSMVALIRDADEITIPQLRTEKLINETHTGEGLTEGCIIDLILEFADVFALDVSELGSTDSVTHVIGTGDSSPIKQPPRRVPFALRARVENLVGEMLKQGVVTQVPGVAR